MSFLPSFRRHIAQIRQEGPQALLRKLGHACLLLFYLPVALAVRALRPWLLVRIGTLPGHRIGHFAAATELYLCERESGLHPSARRNLDIFYCPERPLANLQLHRMWKRLLPIAPFDLSPLERLIRLWPGAQDHVVSIREHGRDIQGITAGRPPHLSFLPEELQRGRALLRAMKVPEDAPFVCFYERDSAYLKAVFPDHDWQYHDYRDGSILSYLPAARALVGRQYHAIRVGAIVAEGLEDRDPRIIDYASCFRSDFMDVFLCAMCRFFLGNPAGLINISMAFRRPCAMVNLVPLEYVPAWGPADLFIPKKYWLIEERRFMTFREIIDSGAGRFLRSSQFEERGIQVVDNTPDEITALALEMDNRLQGTWRTTEEDEQLQRRFWSLFRPSDINGVFRARVGADFLRRHSALLPEN